MNKVKLNINYYLKRHKLLTTFVIIMTFLSALLTASMSIFLQYLVDFILDSQLMLSIYLVIGFCLAFFVIVYSNNIIKNKLIETINYEYRQDIVSMLFLKNIDEFNKHTVAEYISLYSNDFKRIEDEYLYHFFNLFEYILVFIMGIVILTIYSWVFTIVMVAMIIMLIIIPSIMGNRLEKLSKELSVLQNNTTTDLEESLRGFEVIKTYDKISLYNKMFENSNKSLKKGKLKFNNFKGLNETTSGALSIIMQIVVSIVGAYFIYLGKLSYGSLLGVIQCSGTVVNPLFQLFALVPVLSSYKPLFNKINEFLENKQLVEKDIHFDKVIELSNVTFAFEDKLVLDNINLKFEKNNKYLIIGESGSGKSTLVKLIAGYYHEYEGDILFDSDSIHNVKITSICKNISLIHQNIYLFDDTIKSNITFGIENNDKLQLAINNSGVGNFLDGEGVMKKVGENGKNLSGGQKQRIAVARALFVDKPIIILDEGVSALDKKTSCEIENKLLDDANLTIISISHHINEELLKKYDEIIVIEEGKIKLVNKPDDFINTKIYNKYVK